MRLKALVPDGFALRGWARRIHRSSSARPDVIVQQLARKIAVLEGGFTQASSERQVVADVARILAPRQYPGLRLRRYGSRRDGGYVLPEKLVEESVGAVSLGVGDNNDADVALAQSGLLVHAWDHTVKSLPRTHERIVFHRLGLGTGRGELRTFSEICQSSFPHQGGDLVLMMDVEGAEWQVIEGDEFHLLKRFSVISIELHDLGDILLGARKRVLALERLTEEFVPVAVHANNHGAVWEVHGVKLPDCLEATLVRRDLLTGQGEPGNCDERLFSRCCPDLPEVELPWAKPA